MRESQPVCTDDYGESVYRCHWTDAFVWAGDVIWTGPIIPHVKARHAAAPGYQSARRQSAVHFAESEQNCNTCRYLERIKHAKEPHGFLYGRCDNERRQWEAHPYRERIDNAVMIFHPDDYMGMPCHNERDHRNI